MLASWLFSPLPHWQSNESALLFMYVLFSELDFQLPLCTSVDSVQVYVLVPFHMFLAQIHFVGMSTRLSLLAFEEVNLN